VKLNRGDVALARFPHAAGGRGKKRPVVVVQANAYNQMLRHVIVAEVTTNLGTARDPANLLIDVATPDGQATGLVQNSVVTCLHLVTMSEDRIGKVIGRLSTGLLQGLDSCLKCGTRVAVIGPRCRLRRATRSASPHVQGCPTCPGNREGDRELMGICVGR
jgi:mRNA interferase MazF